MKLHFKSTTVNMFTKLTNNKNSYNCNSYNYIFNGKL